MFTLPEAGDRFHTLDSKLWKIPRKPSSALARIAAELDTVGGPVGVSVPTDGVTDCDAGSGRLFLTSFHPQSEYEVEHITTRIGGGYHRAPGRDRPRSPFDVRRWIARDHSNECVAVLDVGKVTTRASMSDMASASTRSTESIVAGSSAELTSVSIPTVIDSSRSDRNTERNLVIALVQSRYLDDLCNMCI